MAIQGQCQKILKSEPKDARIDNKFLSEHQTHERTFVAFPSVYVRLSALQRRQIDEALCAKISNWSLDYEEEMTKKP